MSVNGTSGRLPERYPPTGISVLIVGGGVAGLLAALECWRKGHNVRIIERTPSRTQSGDVLTIGSSAVRKLRTWPDMSEENDRISYEMWLSWHKINGDLISGPAPFRPTYPPKNDYGDDSYKNSLEPKPKIYRHRRHAIHKMLSDQVDRAGLEVEYGKRVVRFEESEDAAKGYAILENGDKLEADVVVAADGIGSKACSLTQGQEVKAKPTGYSMYRAMLPVEQAITDPIVDEKFPILGDGRALNQMWLGEEVYALFGRTEVEMLWYLTYPNKGTSDESWSNVVEPEVVLQTTAGIPGWPDFANRLIKATKKEQLSDFKLVFRDPQPSWVSPGGRIVQVGDAAHTFLPSSGHGATQGIEDGVSLAECLRLSGKDSIPWATRVHNKLRFERVSCLQLLGVLNHELRNRSANADKSQTKPVGLFGSWIWRHDPEKYATDNYEKARAHLEKGKEFQNTNIPPGYRYKPWTIDQILNAKETGEKIELEGDWD